MDPQQMAGRLRLQNLTRRLRKARRSRRRQHTFRFRPRLEGLEQRRVLAALAEADGLLPSIVEHHFDQAAERAEGENATGTIGGTVWGDRDGDGVQDAGEPGLPGVSVSVFNPVDGLIGNGNDVQVGASATTDSSGDYAFTPLVAGSYYVQFTQPAEHAFSPDNQGADDAVDSDANRNPARDAQRPTSTTMAMPTTEGFISRRPTPRQSVAWGSQWEVRRPMPILRSAVSLLGTLTEAMEFPQGHSISWA